MIALLQRVSEARVPRRRIGHRRDRYRTAGAGLCRAGRHAREADALLARLLGYRVFSDETGRMNRSLRDVGGGLLLVPEFTLAADTRSGTRPSFTPAAPPEAGRRLFDHVVTQARAAHTQVAAPGCSART
jgi:D-tyrosyl-tRNA(Tyr) deacylase